MKRAVIRGQAWFYVLIDCTGKIKTKWTRELRISFPKIANILCTALTLLQNFIMHFKVRSDIYTIQFQPFLFKAWMHNNMEEEKWWRERRKRVTKNDMEKCNERLCNQTYMKLSKTIEKIPQKHLWNACMTSLFYLSHLPLYLAEHEENSRTSSFE